MCNIQKFLLLVLCLAAPLALAAQHRFADDPIQRPLPVAMGYSAVTPIHHTWYTAGYDTVLHIPLWTYYRYSGSMDSACYLPRKGSFRKDPLAARWKQATGKDYLHSGWAKGHLVPCEDMTFDALAMDETFYYTNAFPQAPGLNGGRWAQLEKRIRAWAKEYEELHVFTGILMDTSTTYMGKNKIAVPLYCYKVIYDTREPDQKAIAFLFPNHGDISGSWSAYTCTVLQLETRTGLDFMGYLPDRLEHRLETVSDTAAWNWDSRR